MAVTTYFCIDAHTCGNPVRVVAAGGPKLEGADMGQKRLFFLKHFDHVRRGLMYEPRGHDMMSGTIIYPPHSPEADCAVLFIETSGCLPMCGHGTIGTVTVLIERGLVTPQTPGKLILETPAGRVDAYYEMEGQRVSSVRIVNVPSFVYARGLTVACPDLGPLTVDVAYGGNFYAIVEPQEHYSDMADHTPADLIRWSPVLRSRLNEAHTFVHPTDPAVRGLSHILWTGRAQTDGATARNAVFYGDKALDRSPCGTGTSARMAHRAALGLLNPGDDFVHESIIGSCFTGRIEARTRVGDLDAIVPSIQGWARVTGLNTIFIDDEDPYAHGFQVV